MKSLDSKLAAYRENPAARDSFIIADAKDPDMAFGIPALGKRPVSYTHLTLPTILLV